MHVPRGRQSQAVVHTASARAGGRRMRVTIVELSWSVRFVENSLRDIRIGMR